MNVMFIQTALHPICLEIWNGMVLVNNKLRAEDEILLESSYAEGSTGKGKRGKKSNIHVQEVIHVELYTQTVCTENGYLCSFVKYKLNLRRKAKYDYKKST